MMPTLMTIDGMSYQWNCSQLDEENGFQSLPDLTDDRNSIAEHRYHSAGTRLVIHTIPSALDCNGIVMAVEFCYATTHTRHILTLLTLDGSGSNFTITDVIPVYKNPDSEICAMSSVPNLELTTCCDTYSLNASSQFPLPVPNFAFGILPNTLSLLQFRYTDVTNSYSFDLGTASPTIGQVYSLTSPVTKRLRFFNFLIGPSNATKPAPTSTATSTAPTATTNPITTSTATSTAPTATTNPITNSTATSTGTEPSTNSTGVPLSTQMIDRSPLQSSPPEVNTTTQKLPTSANITVESSLPLILGVAGGSVVVVVVVVAVAILAVVAIIAVTVTKQRRSRRDRLSRDLAGMETSTNNAYGLCMSGINLLALDGNKDKFTEGQYEHIDSRDYEVILPKKKEDNLYETIESTGAILLLQEASLLSNANASNSVSSNQAYGAVLKGSAHSDPLDAGVDATTNFEVNEAYHTSLEANTAYGVNSAGEEKDGDQDKYNYTDIGLDTTDSLGHTHIHTNRAYGVQMETADVKANMAYGINSAGEIKGGDCEDKYNYMDIDLDATDSLAHTLLNEAYGVHTAIADMEANGAYGVNSAEEMKGEDQNKHNYTHINLDAITDSQKPTLLNEAFGVNNTGEEKGEDQDKHNYTDIDLDATTDSQVHTLLNECYAVHIPYVHQCPKEEDESNYTTLTCVRV